MSVIEIPFCHKVKQSKKPILPNKKQSNPNDKSCVEIPDGITAEQLDELLKPSD